MPVDALMLLSRVVDRAAEKWGQTQAPSSTLALDESQRTEMLVEVLATQLIGFLTGGSSQTAAPQRVEELERICRDQVARNGVLARALGACECWGELPTCEYCAGRGAPGWRPPDPPAFNVLVRPVLRRMHQHRPFAYRPQRGRGSWPAV